ncbi:molybdenum ABC transporter ATP-binding protein [Sphingomonas sp. Leaf407]|uniref:ATP-binding cassette domain-containing protein n=1 Tax=unclassified Sphingomonas TaxID=196159 RepID=UPI0006F57BFA|nr:MULTISPECIES: ATP-binding cassette domain-containing protein [unclassified Sphingomonas]KQN34877.1 molybdenum ABC transporter ATP-binding protein [Sphingomonas sp. Leaf42]KQT25429.1 molybdenum ABC transporter ATP-binding protein [Sphingomonas sp. Leaf407]
MSFEIDVTVRLGEAVVGAVVPDDGRDTGLTVLFGPSGVGKSSVLNMVAGLLRPAAGHVRVGGETLFDSAAGIDVPVARRRCGYVFQEPRLFPHRRVAANLRYGMGRGTPLVGYDDMVALLGLGPLLRRWPATLSGGEAKRVAIGRALLSGARFLLMDEPLSSLDRARREEVMATIERLRDALALPILYVTHDLAEAERLATRIVRM